MKQFYTIWFIACLLLSSCGLKIGYLGNNYSPTDQVDVYVDASSIKKRYEVVGKGYIESLVHTRYTVKKLQAKAVELAKRNGADAVLFQDYYFQHPGTQIQTTTRTDTVIKGIVVSTNSDIMPVVTSGRNILFLKYQ